MATLTYYSFSKKHKSTKQPASGSDITVSLKDGVSLTNPIFLLNWSGFPSFNYCQFEDRYYFVTDIRQIRNDLFEVECEEDYLASWKSDIGALTAMILYASGSIANIIDSRIPVSAPVYVSNSNASISGITITDGNQGTIVLSITGTGSFGNYVMQASNRIFELMRDMDNWVHFMITDPITGFQQLCGSGQAPDNLKGAIALPFIASSMTSGALEDLYLGNYPCVDTNDHPIKGYRVTDPLAIGTCTVSIPWRYSDWRRHSPYTSIYLYLPLVGEQMLSADDLINDSALNIVYSINITSGDVSVEVRGASSNRIVCIASSNCAMATPYGSANISAGKVAQSIATGAAGVLAAALAPTTGGATAALFGGLTASASQMLSASHGETKGGGGLGGGASHGLTKVVICSTVSKDLTDSQANLDAVIGKPVMQKATIGSYSGFVQTEGAQIEGLMNNREREVINSLLDGGFYYE